MDTHYNLDSVADKIWKKKKTATEGTTMSLSYNRSNWNYNDSDLRLSATEKMPFNLLCSFYFNWNDLKVAFEHINTRAAGQ